MNNTTRNSTLRNNQRHAFTQHLGRLLVHAVYGAARAPGMIRRVLTVLTEIRRSQCKLRERQDENAHQMQELSSAQEAIYQQLQLLSQSQQRQNDLIRTQLDALIVQPLASRLLPIFDLLDQSHARRHDESSGNTHRNMQELNRAMRTHLIELLGTYDIEPIPVRPDDAFDSDAMRPVESCRTEAPDQNRRVAAVIRRGFRRHERVLRPAGVRLYRYHAPVLE